MSMDTAVKPEMSDIDYKPTAKELELRFNPASRLQRVKGSPRVFYVEVENSGPAVFKSKYYKGKIISDVENEVAAYLISHITGFDFVPPAVLRTIEGKEGSLQEFVEEADDLSDVEETPGITDQLYKYWIFGHIVRNVDRYDDNLLVKNGKVFSIDHEASFSPNYSDPACFDDYRSYYGQAAPDSLVEIFRRFNCDNTQKEILRKSLRGLISSEDIEITVRRMEQIGRLLTEKGRVDVKEELAIA
jgi:hypothetical protein